MITISSSTISSNQAQYMGGLYFENNMGTAEVIDSTISGNQATDASGAVYARGVLKLANSTVAFNRDQFGYPGVSVGGTSLLLESSIIAGNGRPVDLWVGPMTTLDASSSNNLVVAATGVQLPADTIHDCPQLDILADNGGATLTHALMPASPAIDQGNPENLVFDQTGWVRVEGMDADIGAFEWRSGAVTERIWAGGFDGLCDQ
jgi:hypothetical protein